MSYPPGLFFQRRNLFARSYSRRLSWSNQLAPHPSPLPRERELVLSGATAFTLAMVFRGDSFDSSAILLQWTPHPSPLPRERNLAALRARFLVATMCDDRQRRVLTDSDIPRLLALPPDRLDELFMAAAESIRFRSVAHQQRKPLPPRNVVSGSPSNSAIIQRRQSRPSGLRRSQRAGP